MIDPFDREQNSPLADIPLKEKRIRVYVSFPVKSLIRYSRTCGLVGKRPESEPCPVRRPRKITSIRLKPTSGDVNFDKIAQLHFR
jgi:hypothetical protein